MINKLLGLIFLFSFTSLFAQTTAIPDTNFEQKLITLGIDTNGANGNILNSDALAVTTLTLTGNTITNLTGLEAFVNVVTLNLGNNQFTTVPLSTLTSLESFQFSGNSVISTLDFSQNILLKTVNISANNTSNTTAPLASLDFTNNINLVSLRIQQYGNLTNLVFPSTPTLTKIDLTYLGDPTLNFSQISNLEELIIVQSAVPVVITLPNVQTNLKKIGIYQISIPTIDLSMYSNLVGVNLNDTAVQNLLLPNSTTLTQISVYGHNLQTTTSFTGLPNLQELQILQN